MSTKSRRREAYPSSYTDAAVSALLDILGPDGAIWRTEGVQQVLSGLAGGWRRLFERANAALNQFWGSTADETLSDWIVELGLDSDTCTTLPTDEDELRALVSARSTALGGQSAAYYTAIAAALGVEISIEEGPTAPYANPECGVAQCGDELAGVTAGFIWRVTAPAATPTSVRAQLECLINRTRPAHTLVEYVYA